jgi:hypothetical protein
MSLATERDSAPVTRSRSHEHASGLPMLDVPAIANGRPRRPVCRLSRDLRTKQPDARGLRTAVRFARARLDSATSGRTPLGPHSMTAKSTLPQLQLSLTFASTKDQAWRPRRPAAPRSPSRRS